MIPPVVFLQRVSVFLLAIYFLILLNNPLQMVLDLSHIQGTELGIPDRHHANLNLGRFEV